MKKILSSIIILLLICMPTLVFSQGGGIVSDCSGPDCGFSDLIQLIFNVFNFFITFGIIVSSLAFAYAGFLYITSQGDTSKISRATKIFTNFAIGLFLLLSSFLIIQLILNSLGLDSIFSNNFIDL